MKKLFISVAALVLVPALSFGQYTSPGYGGGTAGGKFTTPQRGPTGCTNPAFSFSVDTDAGMCASAANLISIRTGQTSATDRASVTVSGAVANTPSAVLAASDQANNTAQARLLLSGGVSYFQYSLGANLLIESTSADYGTSFGPAAAYDRLKMTPAASGTAFTGSFVPTDLTAARTYTAPDISGTILLNGGANTLTGTNLLSQMGMDDTATAVNLFRFRRNDAAGTVTVTRSVAASSSSPSFVVTASDTSGSNVSSVLTISAATTSGGTPYASLRTTKTGATVASQIQTQPEGVLISNFKESSADAFNQDPYTLIEGGYTLANHGGETKSLYQYSDTPHASSTVTVVVVDTTPSIIAGNVQVCGYVNTTDRDMSKKTCETIDFSGGAGSHATAQVFVLITQIKSSSFNVLGGAGDETITASWTTGGEVMVNGVNLVNSSKSNLTSTGDFFTVYSNFWRPQCLDLQGCDVALDVPSTASGQAGRILYIVGRTSTTTLTFPDSGQNLGGARGVDADDTLTLLYANSKWVELGFVNN